jgi:hypothetical protein
VSAMRNVERRELVEGFLNDLRSQRDVDLRDALEELIHLTLDLDERLKAVEDRIARLEDDRPHPG